MSILLFPNLKPKLIDSSWFDVDQPCDDEDDVTSLEMAHENWLHMISQSDSDVTPIGKTNIDDDEDDEEEEDNLEDEESESHDEEEEDEIEMDVSQERNSPVDVSINNQ